MHIVGAVSAANVSTVSGAGTPMTMSQSPTRTCSFVKSLKHALASGNNDAMFHQLKRNVSSPTTKWKRGHELCPLKVLCVDRPRPELEATVSYIEAAQLSSFFLSSPPPERRLKIVIAGAGKEAYRLVLALEESYEPSA